MTEPTEEAPGGMLDIGTATRDNEDGTWSVKLQVDGIPSERVANGIVDWLEHLVSKDLKRVEALLNAKRGRLQ